MTLDRVAFELRVVDPGGEIVDVLEHDGATLVLQEPRIRGADLHHRPVRAEAAAKHDERAAARRAARRAGGSRRCSMISAPAMFSPTVRPRDRDRVQVQQVGDLRHHGGEPAGVEEVLHQVSGRQA